MSGPATYSGRLALGVTQEYDYAIDDVLLSGAYGHSIFRDTVDTPCVWTLTDDDADDDAYDYVRVELEERGLVGNFALTWDYIDTANKLTIAEAKILQDNGHELVHHSKTHGDITGGSPSEWDKFLAETLTNADAFEAANLRIDSFKDPGTWSGEFETDTLDKTLNRYGRAMRSRYAAWSGYYNGDVFNYTLARPVLHHYGPGAAITIDEITSLATLQGVIDNGIKYQGLVYMETHARNFDTADHLTKANFEAMLDYVVTKRDAGLLTCMTYTQAIYAGLGPRTNLLADPFFEESVTGTYVGWSVAAPGAGAPVIAAGGDGGARKITINNANAVQQQIRADNLRTVELYAVGRPANAAATSTARVEFRQVDSAGNTVVTRTVAIALAASTTWQPIRAFTRMDPRAVRCIVLLTSPDATYSEWSTPALMRA
jgi:hypothetical protein